jgi:ribosome-binding protein aMBF1 (putative translation factor)
MALDDRTAQEQLTPDERRELLRAFADRMLLKISAMDDPEDMPGVERAVRVATVIERVYSRCDQAERQIRDKTPDPHKVEAERATHKEEAIKARVSLANTLEWGEKRRRDLGPWWDAAKHATEVQASPQTAPLKSHLAASETLTSQDGAASAPASSSETPAVNYIDYTDAIHQARAALGLKDLSAAEGTKPAQKPPPS